MCEANVAFVINRNYIGQFKVTFYSLVKANNNLNIFVHLLHSDLSDEDKSDINRFVNSYNAKINFYKIDDSFFEGLPKMGYDASYTAYYKVLVPYILGNLEKVLFLDCDIIVRKSIMPLFEEDSNAFLSCVEDYKINRKRRSHKLKIIGDEKATYFNSGVMLFDFSKADGIAPQEKVISYIAENKEVIRWHDQDILNHFYAKDCRLLDEKYNYLTTYKSVKDMFFPKGKKRAVIVHYANWKPWKSNYIGKYYGLYKSNYNALKGEKCVDFLMKKSLKEQLKLIFKYLKR